MTLRSRIKKSASCVVPGEANQCQQSTRRDAAPQPDLPVFSFQDADNHHFIDPFACLENFSFVSNARSIRAPSANRNNTPTPGNLLDQFQCFRSNNKDPCELQSAFTPDLSRGAYAAMNEDPTREIQDFEEGLIFFKKKRLMQRPVTLKHRTDSTCCNRPEQCMKKKDPASAAVFCECKASTCKGKHCADTHINSNKKKRVSKALCCTCKKSGCQNNYCPCHQARTRCSHACYCGTCHNEKPKNRDSDTLSEALKCNSAIRLRPKIDEPALNSKASLLVKRKPSDVKRTLVVSQLAFAPF